MKILLKYLRKYWLPFSIAIFCLSAETLGDLLQPTIMAQIVDQGIATKDMDYVTKMGIIMMAVTAIGAVMAFIRSTIATTLSQNVGASIRYELYEKIHRLSFQDLDDFQTGSLITRMTNDVNNIQNFVMGIMRIFVKAPLVAIGGVIMAILLSPKMSLILITLIPFVAFLLIRSMKKGYPNFEKAQEALDKVNGRMREYLSGVRVVKAFNRFEYEVKRFEEVNNQLADTSMKSMQIMAIYMPLISLVVNLGIIAVLWIGGFSVRVGSFQLGKIIALVNYMTQILHALVMISNIFMMLVRTKTSAQRVEDVLVHGISMQDEADEVKTVDGSITFQNVSFRYDGEESELALEKIDFHLRAGQTLGIIGSTGSGKTTLVNLIARFYDATEGSIRIGGVLIREIPFEQLRKIIAYVPQKAVLFSGSIRDNLHWGKNDARQEELQAVCEVADAHGFISSFPKGYDTLLGQGGVNLSGGQKQRISIARALLKEPKILILDDSTSAVDMTTDRRIRHGLKERAKHMSVILVAQRISSIIDSDLILVLEEGRISGSGTHEELLKKNEIYRTIYESQLGVKE